MKRYFYLMEFMLLPLLIVVVLYDVFLRGSLQKLAYAWKYEIVAPAKVTWSQFTGRH